MNINMTQKEEIGIVKIDGNIIASNANKFKESIQNCIVKSKFLVLDLSNVEFIDSTGLGAIISMLKYISDLNGKIVIANLQAKPRMLFKITHVESIIDVYGNIEKASQQLKNSVN